MTGSWFAKVGGKVHGPFNDAKLRALAAAGAGPEEIAWKTGLPVDAVSMLLTMAVARQVPPPLA
jgi:hypothetical protein